MTEAEKKMKKYTRAVNRKLNIPSDVKKRVMTTSPAPFRAEKKQAKQMKKSMPSWVLLLMSPLI